jgi:hypothetical protein
MMTKKKLPGYVGPRPHFCIMQHDGGWYARADFWAALAGLLFVFPLPFAFIPSPFIPPFPTLLLRRGFQRSHTTGSSHSLDSPQSTRT